jgi:hypothetical protein
LSQLTFNTNSFRSPGPFLPDYVSQSTLQGQKRKQDENIYPADVAASVPCKKWKLLLSIDQKLTIVYNAINKEASWSFSKFIFYFFWDKNEHGKPVHCEQSHASTMQCFLTGDGCFSPADILACWFDHKDGCLNWNLEYMYSTTSFKDIKAVQPCLVSFVVQVVRTEMVQEAEHVI